MAAKKSDTIVGKSGGKAKDRSGGKPEHPAGTIIIKKYPNRRLYNTKSSKYIVLKDVVELVRDGEEFVIEDAKTGGDITRTIMNQIIFEQETKPSNFLLPLEFQKQLISLYGDSYGPLVPDYLTKSLNFFAKERRKMVETMGSVVDRNAKAMMDFSQSLAKQNMELFRKSWDMFGFMPTVRDNSSNGAEGPDPADISREEELEEIQTKIDELQNRLKELK